MKIEQLKQIAANIEKVFHQQGHPTMTVQVLRGHAVVKLDDEVLARFTPGPSDELNLSYRNHRGKWEPIPFAAPSAHEAAQGALDVLAPHIQAFTDF